MHLTNWSSASVSTSIKVVAILLVLSIQVCAKEESDLREAIVAAHQFGKGYKAISKLFAVHWSTLRNVFHK